MLLGGKMDTTIASSSRTSSESVCAAEKGVLRTSSISTTTVAFEDVPLGSGAGAGAGGCAAPKVSRATSRHCAACEHKASLTDVPELPGTLDRGLATAPGILETSPVTLRALENAQRERHQVTLERAPVTVTSPAVVRQPVTMAAKSENMTEGLEDRDPNSLNQHVQIVWDDIIGEPEGARSPECAWRLSNACFQYSRNWCYTGLAVLIAPPCALLLGCGFACLAFEQIWCTGPCLRCVKIYLASLRTMVQAGMAAAVVPACEAVGHACRHIRVNFRKEAPEEKDLLVV